MMAEITLESLYHLVENMADFIMTKVATKAEVGQLAERIGRLEERVSRIEERLGQLEERVTRIEERITRIEERVTRIEERVTQIEERVTRIEKRLDELTIRVDLLTVRLTELEAAFEQFRVEVSKRFDQVMVGMDAQAGQLETLRTELASQSHTLDVYNLRIGDLEEGFLGKRVRDENEEEPGPER